jgi:hypothetical protein
MGASPLIPSVLLIPSPEWGYLGCLSASFKGEFRSFTNSFAAITAPYRLSTANILVTTVVLGKAKFGVLVVHAIAAMVAPIRHETTRPMSGLTLGGAMPNANISNKTKSSVTNSAGKAGRLARICLTMINIASDSNDPK